MQVLPIFKESTLKCLEEYIDVDILNSIEDDDYIDILKTNYPFATLDIFKAKLENNSLSLDKLSSEYFRLGEESKYISFISDIYLKNNNSCIIHTGMLNANMSNNIYVMSELDLIDKHIFLNLLIKLYPNKSQYFVIDDIDLLRMIIRGILREYFQAELYFVVKPIIIFSNFDMSLPICCKKQEDYIFYEKLANKNDLFFR